MRPGSLGFRRNDSVQTKFSASPRKLKCSQPPSWGRGRGKPLSGPSPRAGTASGLNFKLWSRVLTRRIPKEPAAYNNSLLKPISAIRGHEIHPEEVLTRARALREKTAGYLITDDEFTEAKTVR